MFSYLLNCPNRLAAILLNELRIVCECILELCIVERWGRIVSFVSDLSTSTQ